MSKGLEALEKAKKRTGLPLNKEFAPVTIDELDIIEKELKDKEKKDKAIEIIKDKRVQVGDLLYSSCLEAYNSGRDKVYRLFQEEYELLKEVML